MAFPKDKIAENLKEQIEALDPKMKKMGFIRNTNDFNWADFYHSESSVIVKLSPVRQANSCGYYAGFKLHIHLGYYDRGIKRSKLVNIDNMKAVQEAIDISIEHNSSQKEEERLNKSFESTLKQTLPRLFPGRSASVSEFRGKFHVSMMSTGDKPSVSIDISRSGQIDKVEISYPKKGLPEVAKLLEAW